MRALVVGASFFTCNKSHLLVVVVVGRWCFLPEQWRVTSANERREPRALATMATHASPQSQLSTWLMCGTGVETCMYLIRETKENKENVGVGNEKDGVEERMLAEGWIWE